MALGRSRARRRPRRRGGRRADDDARPGPEPDERRDRGLIDGSRLLRSHVGSRTIVVLIGAGSSSRARWTSSASVLALELLGHG